MSLHLMELETLELQAPLALNQFAGPIAVEPLHLTSAMASVRAITQQEIEARTKAHAESVDRQKEYQVVDGIAHVQLSGVISKGGSSLSGAGSTVAARYALRSASKDPSVKAILFHVESPGGAWAGTSELNQEVMRIRKSGMEVWIAGNDIVASGGYLASTSANKIWLNDYGRVGSIGVYQVIVDSSGAYEKAGYSVDVVKFGANKGIGVEGTKITAEQIASLQKSVNDIGALFVEQVSKGRAIPMEKALSWADGETHSARAAVAMGMIDSIGTPEEAHAALLAHVKGKSAVSMTGAKTMTLKEIVAACEGIDDTCAADQAFLIKLQKDENLTESKVMRAWAAECKGRVDAANDARTKAANDLKALQDAKASEQADAKQREDLKPGGNKSPKDKVEGSGAGDSHVESGGLHPYILAVKERSKIKGISDREAMIELDREQPQLRKSYLFSVNRGATTLVGNPEFGGKGSSSDGDGDE